MTDNLLLWWQGRSPRERGLLAIMFVLFADRARLADGGAAFVRRARRGAHPSRHGRGRARRGALARRHKRRAGSSAPLPIDSLIGRTAAEAGFAGARIAAQGPARASVTIDAARPQAAFGWLALLEGSGLVVERLHVQANSDRTLRVEASLRARAR